MLKNSRYNEQLDIMNLRLPDLPEWTGESRIQVNSPDSRSDPRREATSPGI